MADEPIPGSIEGQKAGLAGWDWLDRVNEQHQQKRDETSGFTPEEMQRYYAQTFSTKAGQIVLEDLRQRGEIDTFNPNLGFFDGAAWGYWRSGANGTINFIMNMVRAGQSRRRS